MLGSEPQERGHTVVMNAIVGRSSVSFETCGTGTSNEMATRRKDGNEAKQAGGIVVQKDIE